MISLLELFQIVLLALGAVVWAYVTARMVTRAIVRTLDERKQKSG